MAQSRYRGRTGSLLYMIVLYIILQAAISIPLPAQASANWYIDNQHIASPREGTSFSLLIWILYVRHVCVYTVVGNCSLPARASAIGTSQKHKAGTRKDQFQ